MCTIREKISTLETIYRRYLLQYLLKTDVLECQHKENLLVSTSIINSTNVKNCCTKIYVKPTFVIPTEKNECKNKI